MSFSRGLASSTAVRAGQAPQSRPDMKRAVKAAIVDDVQHGVDFGAAATSRALTCHSVPSDRNQSVPAKGRSDESWSLPFASR